MYINKGWKPLKRVIGLSIREHLAGAVNMDIQIANLSLT